MRILKQFELFESSRKFRGLKTLGVGLYEVYFWEAYIKMTFSFYIFLAL